MWIRHLYLTNQLFQIGQRPAPLASSNGNPLCFTFSLKQQIIGTIIIICCFKVKRAADHGGGGGTAFDWLESADW